VAWCRTMSVLGHCGGRPHSLTPGKRSLPADISIRPRASRQLGVQSAVVSMPSPARCEPPSGRPRRPWYAGSGAASSCCTDRRSTVAEHSLRSTHGHSTSPCVAVRVLPNSPLWDQGACGGSDVAYRPPVPPRHCARPSGPCSVAGGRSTWIAFSRDLEGFSSDCFGCYRASGQLP
jgi:hypothetical protein